MDDMFLNVYMSFQENNGISEARMTSENPVTDKQVLQSVLPWRYLTVPGGLGPAL